jgi:RNA polymerase sigma-70 factor (ECF subfamily)
MQRTAMGEEISRLNRCAQPDMTEQEAIVQAQNGDPAAFEYLYRSHSRRVFALCLRMIGNSSDAEDLTQEAFLQVFRRIDTFRGESAFSTWLHRVSVNVVLMRLRKRTVKETPLEDSATGDEFDEQHKEFVATGLALTGSIDRVHLERAIAQLPPGYKRAFVLHDVHGYEHNEIAEVLGCSIGNSKSQLHKARTRLRMLLREAGRENQHQKELHLQPV